MPEDRFIALLAELERFGEDPEELEYWRSIWPDMQPAEQAQLVVILEAQVLGLRKSAGGTLSPQEEQLLATANAQLEQSERADLADVEAARRDGAEEQVQRIKESL